MPLRGGISFSLSSGKLLIELLVLCFSLCVTPLLRAQDVLTYHNDNARTGQTLTEMILTPASVNSSAFGKLFVASTDGKVDAQPLYVSAVTIPGNGTTNLLIVASEHDSLYAFNADNGALLWQVSLLGSGETTAVISNCSQVSPEIGITATPVIDRGSGPNGTIYAVAMSQDAAANYHQRLHALDLTTGLEEFGGPMEITATFPGTGDNSQNGMVVFDPGQYKERPGLLLLNEVVYTTWSSHCDHRPYTGWIMGYSETSLAQVSILNITPNGNDGAFWSSGGGPAADGNGNIYILAGNGTFDTVLDSNGFPVQGDYGNGFLKLSVNGTSLTVSDYFNMSNTGQESGSDVDLGSGGALLLPDLLDVNGNTRHLAVGAGKDQNLYVVDRDNMGKFDPNNNFVFQELVKGLSGGIKSLPAYFNGTVYYGPIGKPIQAFLFSNGQFLAIPTSQTTTSFAYPGATPSISANQNANAILWATENTSPAVLHAYDATNLGTEFYNSNQAAGGRDQFGIGNKFITPMIANGKVYVGTTTGVGVFGILPGTTTTTLSSSSNPALGGQAVTFTAVVTAPAGIPTGTITFSDSGAGIGTVVLDGTGTAALATATLAAGSHSIVASYGGDANDAPSTSPVVSQVIVGQTPTMLASSSLNPSTYGQPVTFTANVSPSSSSGPTPTGTVAFKDTTTSLTLGIITLNSGSASVASAATALAVQSHTVTATYSGDTNYASSTATVTQTVNPAATAASLTSSANPSSSGASVTFTATVTWSGPGAVTGTVNFKDGATVLGTTSLNSSGVATFSTSTLSAGTHSLTAHCNASTNFAASDSSVLSQVVNGSGSGSASTTVLVSALNPSAYGQPVTFTANVSPSSSSGPTPTGTVAFKDTTKGLALGTVTLNSGNASVTTAATAFAVGSHTVTATYSGDTNYSSSTTTVAQTVNQATPTVVITSSLNPSTSGTSVTFTATVTWSGPGVVTGSADLKDSGTIIGAATPLNSSGMATFSTSTLSVGTHSLTIHYKGSTNFAAADSLVLSQVVQ